MDLIHGPHVVMPLYMANMHTALPHGPHAHCPCAWSMQALTLHMAHACTDLVYGPCACGPCVHCPCTWPMHALTLCMAYVHVAHVHVALVCTALAHDPCMHWICMWPTHTDLATLLLVKAPHHNISMRVPCAPLHVTHMHLACGLCAHCQFMIG